MTGPLAILGPGTLGLSTARWAAECGIETRLLGRDLAHAETGLERIHASWNRAVERGRMSPAERGMAAARLSASGFGPAALQGASAFLEALPEAIEIKHPALAAASEWGAASLLVLTGTSAISITELALRSKLEGRLVGFHLFVPVPRMAVVEMAVAPGTLPSWVERARDLGKALKKRVIQVRDQPGFAAARMALAQGLEAMRLLEAGVASAEDLDALMTLGYGHPVGPLELSDRVGLDLRLRIAEGLAAAGEARFQPPPALRALVDAGHTGIRARQGFHHWREGRRTS